MAFSKRSLLAALQLMLLVCAGMCVLCSADFKEHVAVKHGQLRKHHATHDKAVAKTKGSFVKTQKVSACVQVTIPIITGLDITGAVSYSVTYEKDATETVKNVYVMGGELAVSAGLQFNAIIFKLGFYYTGTIGIENKICVLKNDEIERPGYNCAKQVMLEWYRSMFQNKLKRWGKAQANKESIGRLAFLAKKVRDNYASALSEASLVDNLQSDAKRYLIQFRDKLRETALKAHGKIKNMEKKIGGKMIKFSSGGELSTANCPQGGTDCKNKVMEAIRQAVRVWVTRCFRAVFYKELPNMEYNPDTDDLNEGGMSNWQTPTCNDIPKFFKRMMCVYMASGLMLQNPSTSITGKVKAWFDSTENWATIQMGNKNTYNSIFKLFPELFYQGYNRAAFGSENDGRVNHEDPLDMLELDYMMQDFQQAKLKQAMQDDPSNPSIFEMKKKMELVFIRGVTMAELETWSITVAMLVAPPKELATKFEEFRDMSFGQCQLSKQTNLKFYTAGTFGVTAGSSAIGFCTPDTNLLQFQIGWRTTYTQDKNDCLLYKKNTMYMPMKFTVSLGPVFAVDFTKLAFYDKDGKLTGGDFDIAFRFRLLFDAGVTPPAADPPEADPPAGPIAAFNSEAAQKIADFCTKMNKLKIMTGDWGTFGPMFGDALMSLFVGMTAGLKKATTEQNSDNKFMNIVKKIVPNDTPPASGGRYSNREDGGMSWLPSLLKSAAKAALVDSLPDVVASQKFSGINLNIKFDEEITNPKINLEVAQEEVFGLNGGVVAAYYTTETTWGMKSADDFVDVDDGADDGILVDLKQ